MPWFLQVSNNTLRTGAMGSAKKNDSAASQVTSGDEDRPTVRIGLPVGPVGQEQRVNPFPHSGDGPFRFAEKLFF
jgi:hypothetical protein